jgi:hypothetical protein
MALTHVAEDIIIVQFAWHVIAGAPAPIRHCEERSDVAISWQDATL